jgi:hypothetical protein
LSSIAFAQIANANSIEIQSTRSCDAKPNSGEFSERKKSPPRLILGNASRECGIETG